MLAERAGLPPEERLAVRAVATVLPFRTGAVRRIRGTGAVIRTVCIDGVAEVAGLKVFVLRMIQARNPRLAGTPFFARFDPAACWLTDLEPAFAARFPFEPAGYEMVPDELPGLFPREPDEPGELMVPAI